MGWISSKWEWATRKPLFWINLALVAATIAVMFFWRAPMLEPAGPSDLRLRLWGTALQLIGVVTVWLDLTSTARRFGKGGFVRGVLAWVKSLRGNRGMLDVPLGELTLRGLVPRIKQRAVLDSRLALEERLANVERYAIGVDGDLDKAYDQIDSEAATLRREIKSEAEARERAVRAVTQSLEEAAVGNFPMLAFGAAWLAVGLVLATLAPEIARLAAGQWAEVWRAL